MKDWLNGASVGTLALFYGEPAPAGWIRPGPGVTLQKAQYADLYAVLGNCYGGETETTFDVGTFRGDWIMKTNCNG